MDTTTTTTTTRKKVEQATDKVHVRVKPLIGTAANLAVLAGAGVTAGGGVAVAAAAATALGVGAVVRGGQKVKAARKGRAPGAVGNARTPSRLARAGSAGTHRAGSTPPQARTATSGRAPGARTAGPGAIPTARGPRTAGRTQTSTPRTPTGLQTTGSGRRPGLLDRMRPSRTGQQTSARTGSSPRTKGRSARTGPGADQTMTGRLARRARSVANSPARRWAEDHARKVWADARRGAARTSDRTKAARWAVWRGLRDWMQRRVMGRKQTGKANVTGLGLQELFHAGLINGPVNPGADRPLVRPLQSPRTIPVRAHTGGTGPMRDITRQLLQYAQEFDAPGVLEIIDELDNNLEGSALDVAEVFQILGEKCRAKWPFDDAISQKFGMAAECFSTGAQILRGIVPDIETIHEAELRRLRQPAQGQEKFDLSANGLV